MYLALGGFVPLFCILHSVFCIRPKVALGALLHSAFCLRPSVAFPRAEPRFTVHRPGQSLTPNNSPASLPPPYDGHTRPQRFSQVSSLACPPVSDTFTPG
jgi:hypothetical protein